MRGEKQKNHRGYVQKNSEKYLTSIVGGLGLSTYGAYTGNADLITSGFALQDIGIAGGSGFVQAGGTNVLTGIKNEPLGVRGKSGLTGVQANKAQGDAFEVKMMNTLSASKNFSTLQPQVTAKTGSGIRIRIDIIGRDLSGNICLFECKSSLTAPLTKNQTLAFPEILKSGGTIVGKGKPGFPGGTVISPSSVNMLRP